MGTRKKILVIDDDQSVCDSIARSLKGRGYDVFTETKYSEGIRRAEEILPSLVFISLLLDTTNGLKATKELHAIEVLKKVPVIMLISHKGDLDPKYTFTIGIVDVLVKPPAEKDLIVKTEAAIGPGHVEDPEEISTEADLYGSGTVPESQETPSPEEDYQEEESSLGSEEAAPEELLNVAPALSDGGLSVTIDRTEEADYYVPRLRPDDVDYAAVDDDEKEFSEPVKTDDGWMPHKDELHTGEGISGGKEDEDMSFDETRKLGHGKKLLLAAVVVVLAVVAGAGAYLYMNSFLAGNKRPASPASAVRVPSKGSLHIKEKAKELPQASALQPAPRMGKTVETVESGGERKHSSSQEADKKTDRQPVTGSSTADALKKGPELNNKDYFSVQIGYFGDLKNAESLASKMKEKGYKVMIRKEEKAGKSSYRVLVGEFSSRNEAMVQSVAIFRKEGISSVPYKE